MSCDELVGKMVHPLNRPRIDPAAAARGSRATGSCSRASRRRCRRREDASPSSALRRRHGHRSLRRRRVGRVPGPVRRRLYTGKGIYDVDAFEAGLDGRVPDNTVLSHDLFEGIFARAGSSPTSRSSTSFPRTYEVAAERQHRWTRGDWQLAAMDRGARGTDLPAPWRASQDARQPAPLAGDPGGARDADPRLHRRRAARLARLRLCGADLSPAPAGCAARWARP